MYRQLPLHPSRINSACVTGPVYHYDRVSDDDAMLVGVVVLPGPQRGSTTSLQGVTARRLKCGLLNVSVHCWADVLRSRRFDWLVTGLRRLAVEPPIPTELPTRAAFDVDLDHMVTILSPEAYWTGRSLHPLLRPVAPVAENASRLSAGDARRMLDAFSAAKPSGSWDLVYVTGGRLARSAGRIARPGIASGFVELIDQP